MGISFKVAKVGTRYRPKPSRTDEKDDGFFKEKSSSQGEEEQDIYSKKRDYEGNSIGVTDHTSDYSNSLFQSGLHPVSGDLEASFSLNLFPDGFSVGNPTEEMSLPSLQGVPKLLHPYNMASKTLFSAIEYGLLPGDNFDDIPCKYVDGTLACEVRDYRKCMPKSGVSVNSRGKSPVVHKVLLQMCMENVVKDISAISNDSWTYDHLLKFESRILKSLHPRLHLDPKPSLDRLCRTPVSKKLNLGMFGGREKTKQNNAAAAAANLIPNNLSHGNNISSCSVHENSNSQSHFALQSGVPCAQQTFSRSFLNTQKSNIAQDLTCSGSLLTAAAIPSNFVSMPKQDLTDSHVPLKNLGSLLLGKRCISEAQSSQWPNVKRPKQEQLDLVQVQPQLDGSQMDTVLGPDTQWSSSLLQKQLEAEKIQWEKFGGHKYSQLLFNDSPPAILEGIPEPEAVMPSYLVHRGVQCSVKEEPTETGKLYKLEMGKIKDEYHAMDIETEQCNHTQSLVQRLSPNTVAQVPSSVEWNVTSQFVEKDLRREDAIQKRISSQSPRAFALGMGHSSESSKSGDFSSISTGVPYSTSATSIVGLQEKDRYGLNFKKCKYDQFLERKSFSHGPQMLAFQFLKSDDTDSVEDASNDKISMSKCLIRGSLNVCKTRIMTFTRPRHVYQCNGIPIIVNESQNKLVMSEKPKGGKVEVCVLYGEEEYNNPVACRHFSVPPLTNTRNADLFAAQFTSLMRREGYQLTDDQIQPIPFHSISSSSSKQPSAVTSVTVGNGVAGLPPQTLISGESPNLLPIGRNISSVNPQQLPSQNNLAGCHLHPPGNIEAALQLSAEYLSKPQPSDSAASLTSLHQRQHPEIQRSTTLIGNTSNPLGNTRIHTGNKMLNSQAHLLYQLQKRRRQQHQQHPVLQREMMVGALGMMQPGGRDLGFGNLVCRGSMSILGTGGEISAPMGGHVSSLGNVGQINNLNNQVSSFGNLSQQLLAGGVSSTAHAAVLANLRLAHSQGRGILSVPPIQGNSVYGVGGMMTGNSLVHGGSTLGQAISGGDMTQMCVGMTPMGPQNISAITFNMNNQRQQLQQSPHFQRQEQLDPMQQMGQAVSFSLPEQVGSHPTQQISGQRQMRPQTAPQQVNALSVMMSTGSPELSSQTHGSVGGSITSLPME